MRTRVQRWGDSLALRIPRAFAENAPIPEGSLVYISVHDGILAVKPILASTLRLDAALADITEDNIHRETDFGSACGNETW